MNHNFEAALPEKSDGNNLSHPTPGNPVTDSFCSSAALM
jgi:hypothetical protein